MPLQIARLDIGLLFYFAISSLSVYGATLAGWASHNKWAMMGGLRASSQMMSYEVTMGMARPGLVPRLRHAGAGRHRRAPDRCLSLSQLRSSWGIFLQPLGFILFLTAAIAETKRTPFDIPEGEPEIIGYFVEYSGLRFGLFFLGEFLEIVTSSAIMVDAVLRRLAHPGRASKAVPGRAPAELRLRAADVRAVDDEGRSRSAAFQLLIRWSLPRFRSDQLMRLGWQRLLPISIANVVVTAAHHPVGAE